MAQPPKPPTSEERRAEASVAAQAAGQQADRMVAEESHRLAERLLAGEAGARFDALASQKEDLTPAERRRLLDSLIGYEPRRHVIPGGTATRWALIRSRLFYRIGALASAGAIAILAIVGLLVARSNTPQGVVLSSASQDLQVLFTTGTGQVAFDRLEAGRPYALVSQGNGIAVLRRWVAGVGYAEARVPVDVVHWTQ